MPGRIPELTATDVLSAKAWFSATIDAIGGAGWHADDGVADLVGRDGDPLFTEEEADYVDAAMVDLRQASRTWPDPGILYALCGQATFEIETLWPGFVLDTIPDGCLGTGVASMKGESRPNILIEDGQIYVVEFSSPIGRASRMGPYSFSRVDGAVLTEEGFDTTDAEIDRDSTVEFSAMSEVSDLVIADFKSFHP